MKIVSNRHSDLFIKIYRSFLREGGALRVSQIIMPYVQMNPGLHSKAGSNEIDYPAFIYAFLRLPPILHKIDKIILGQTDEVFIKAGYDIAQWEEVSSAARRRKIVYDGKSTLGVFINSVTDVDDIVCLLTAYQIEWNKMHTAFNKQTPDNQTIPQEYDDKLRKIWMTQYDSLIKNIRKQSRDFQIQLLRGSYVHYRKAAQRWFENIVACTKGSDLKKAPIYFVSSNTHSLVNNVTGYVNSLEKELIQFLKDQKMDTYLNYWEEIIQGSRPGSKENFLWYVLKKYEKVHPETESKRVAFEEGLGISYIEAKHYLDINAQVIHLNTLSKHKDLSSKLGIDISQLQNSEACIVNIDYPLGSGAYMVLSTLLRNSENLQGVYILGKASFLNGNLGDIGLPSFVFDNHAKNTIIFKNAFDPSYFSEFKSGNVLSSQKAVTTKGTMLDSEHTIHEYFTSGYNIMEMENGPYLSALYEVSNYDRYPEHEVIDLTNSPVDLGIIHYASDTPFTKAVTLATRNLGYEGVEATYTSSLAILKRIIERELKLK